MTPLWQALEEPVFPDLPRLDVYDSYLVLVERQRQKFRWKDDLNQMCIEPEVVSNTPSWICLEKRLNGLKKRKCLR